MPDALQHWLTEFEKFNLIETLVKFGLVEWSDNLDLKLKSGGTTDIYINLRNSRSQPHAVTEIAPFLANAIYRTGADLFAEIPYSVTPFSAEISRLLDMPYLTVRPIPAKLRQSSDERIIGRFSEGQHVVIFDDVITTGESKIEPYQLLKARDLAVDTIVVMVDHQRGWKKVFAEQEIPLEVWAGMSLHDVRYYLISEGLMQRCDPELQARNPIIYALDGKSFEEYLPLLEKLRPSGGIIKVNDMLMAEGIKYLLPDLSVYGRVMADLKCYDIPQTVENVAKHLAKYPPWAVTVHASGGLKMMQKAVGILREVDTLVLAVTVLTSFDEKTCEEIYVRRPLEQVKELARIAFEAGASGFVCSPQEIRELRQLYPKAILVTPGVRSPGAARGDQARIATPAEALEWGANFVVMGSQITGNADPFGEVQRVLNDELKLI